MKATINIEITRPDGVVQRATFPHVEVTDRNGLRLHYDIEPSDPDNQYTVLTAPVHVIGLVIQGTLMADEQGKRYYLSAGTS